MTKENISILDGTPWMIAEKGGSRILHKIGTRYELKVANGAWHDVITFSKKSGMASIDKLKRIKPFDNDAWKFELVKQSEFELAATLGSETKFWFRKNRHSASLPQRLAAVSC